MSINASKIVIKWLCLNNHHKREKIFGKFFTVERLFYTNTNVTSYLLYVVVTFQVIKLLCSFVAWSADSSWINRRQPSYYSFWEFMSGSEYLIIEKLNLNTIKNKYCQKSLFTYTVERSEWLIGILCTVQFNTILTQRSESEIVVKFSFGWIKYFALVLKSFICLSLNLLNCQKNYIKLTYYDNW